MSIIHEEVSRKLGPYHVAATKLIEYFRPKIIIVVGICAGVSGKCNLGDILVADPCFDWGSGKWERDPVTSEAKFLPAAYQLRVDNAVKHVVRHTAKAEGVLNSICVSFGNNAPESSPKVLIDAMASGASVLQVEELMQDVKGQHKNLIGVEMETYAVFNAAALSSRPRPAYVSMKSVCDFGDEKKNDNLRKYAAHTSVYFMKEFILRYFT